MDGISRSASTSRCFASEDVPFADGRRDLAAAAGTFLGPYCSNEYRGACAAWRRGPIAADARTPVTARAPTLLVSGFSSRDAAPISRIGLHGRFLCPATVTAPGGSHGSAAGWSASAVLHVLDAEHSRMPDVCR